MHLHSKTENQAGTLSQIAKGEIITDLFWLNKAIHDFLLSNKLRHVTFLLPQQSWKWFKKIYKTLLAFPVKFYTISNLHWYETNHIPCSFLQKVADLAARSSFVWLQKSKSARIQCNSERLKNFSQKLSTKKLIMWQKVIWFWQFWYSKKMNWFVKIS